MGDVQGSADDRIGSGVRLFFRHIPNILCRRGFYRGIAHRPFVRRFSLADFVVVKDAKLSNGLLTIDLERQIPEAMKPRRIAINGHTPPAESKRAA